MRIDADYVVDVIRGTRDLFYDHDRSGDVHTKGFADFVTAADVAIEERVQQALKDRYPQVQFMGEEKDNSEIDFDQPVFIMDPVDGTTNLIHDYRQSALSLAYCEEGRAVFGAVYQPYTDELFTAEAGKGAFLNGTPIRVSGTAQPEKSLLLIGTDPYHHELAERNFKTFEQAFRLVADIRRSGSAAIDLCMVACGRADAYFERRLNPWDFGAGVLIVAEAGGKVTDYCGAPLSMRGAHSVVASNGIIGDILVEKVLRDSGLNVSEDT